VGAGILTATIKNYIDRPRPEVVTQLIQVSGLSYPSGHSLAAASLYLTVAILVLASSKNRASNRDPGDDGWDHTAGENISHLSRSALPKRRRQWHIAGAAWAFAERMLFVFP
jgi:membrane-associated phospholipid phosphatase